MRRTRVKLAIGVALLALVVTGAVAVAGGGKTKAKLSGFEEVPAIVTAGEGTFKARISPTAAEINYELSYAGLEGGEVRQGHIHVAQRSVNGGIAAWLCDSATNPAPPPVDVPTCPAAGTVTGTIRPADVQSIDAQGLRTTDTPDARFADLVRALRAGVAYANVHTATYGGGEIRGQIGGKDGHHKNNHDGDH
jgi:CHRD domain